MGRFMDLVEANRQRDHEISKRRTWRNTVLGAVAIVAAAVVSTRRAKVTVTEHFTD